MEPAPEILGDSLSDVRYLHRQGQDLKLFEEIYEVVAFQITYNSISLRAASALS